MPEGYGVPENDAGLMPWSKARAALEQARLYWVSTTRPDGRPHAVPIWGAWLEDTFYFEGSPQMRRALDLMALHQVRRIPVVGDGQRLLGIIAQADIATRRDSARRIATVVEKISQPSAG